MQRPFHWGIIGPGKIAGKFAEDLKLAKGGKLYAVASRSPERAEAFANTHGVTKAYGDYAALAADPEVDVVYIATPHIGHAENTLRCLEAGKAVLCEKPLGMNSEEVARMVATARRCNRFLMEGIWTRLLPGTLQVLRWIQSGRMGAVRSLTADFGFRAPRDVEGRLHNKALGGGALLDIGIYPIFLAQLLLGEPEKIYGMARMSHTGVDLEDNLVFEYEYGRTARLHASLTQQTPSEAWIYCEEGRIQLTGRWHETKEVRILPYEGARGTVIFESEFKGGYGYHFEIDHVHECLQRGLRESPLLPLDFSVTLMRTLDRVREHIGLDYEAAESGT